MVDTIAQSSSEKKAGKAVGSFRNLSENHNNRGKASHKTPGEHSSTVISSKDHDLSHIGQYLLYALPETGGRRPNLGSAAFLLIQRTSAPVRGILVTVAGKKHPITGVMNFCMGPQPRTDFPPFILWVPVIGHLAVMIPVRVSGAVRWQVRWVEA